MDHRFSLVAAALALVACSSAREFRPFPRATGLTAAGPLPATWVADFAMVDIALEGRPAGRFLLDTGASVVLLSPSAVARLGLPSLSIDLDRGGFPLAGADATAATVQRVVPIRELRAGPVSMHDFDAMEFDLAPLQRVLGSPVDGILPATAFRDVVLHLDYGARQVAVAATTPAAESPADGVMPLLPGSLPIVDLPIGATAVPMLLDSGSGGFVTLPAAAPWQRRGEPVVTGRQQTVGGVRPVLQVRADHDLDWAGQPLRAPVVEVGRAARGAVGAALLRHFRVELDQPQRRVRFVRASDGPLPCPPVRSVGLGFYRHAGQWTVAYVLADSPAARAGWREGAAVVAIDGVAVSDLPFGRWEELLATRDRVHLTVRADGRDMPLELPVVVLVP